MGGNKKLVANLELLDALLHRIPHCINRLLVHKVHQALLLLSWWTEDGVDDGVSQHIDGLLQAGVGGVEGAEEVLEVAATAFVRPCHAPADLTQDAHLFADALTEEAGLSAQNNCFLVHLPCVCGEIVGAQDERHRGERLLGGEEMLDKHLDRDIVSVELGGVGVAIVVFGALVVVGARLRRRG
jgi:hypothetical protein